MEEGTGFAGPDGEIVELIRSLGYQVAAYSTRTVNSVLHINLIIYKNDGVSLDDCSLVYRTVIPKMEILYDTRDIHLEVSSPGISRSIKTLKELALYIGRGLSLLVDGNWIGGILKAVGDRIILVTEKGEVELDPREIQKAKLDYTQEVEN